ncbi:methionine-tRNA ligase, cytoplasmic-like protein [Euroglyphus maynei]|uniref:Methionine--tRNA ligase, cytoplasmic n=1 Tax=Euroglyphus maynei TaxID=6958 RepID=A0A1Y3APZ6_EURMA|nr:methionine-tRNA ligase, cytoplasmic-like protein [Euroglyphus maynei]
MCFLLYIAFHPNHFHALYTSTSNTFRFLFQVITSCNNNKKKMSFEVSNDELTEAIREFQRDDIVYWKEPNLSNPNKVPIPGERNTLITSALPYVNNVPHLGNIIGCTLSGDVFARYCRIRGDNVLYICGTDEYGTATENKAQEEKLSPREICDKYHALHDEVYKWFNIEFDRFGRTSTEIQTQIVQDIFKKVYSNGYIIKEEIEQLYCEKCSKFLADRFVEGACPYCAYEDARGDQCDKCGKLINAIELKMPRCKTCSSAPVVKSSRHLFIDLPKLQPKLEIWLDETLKKENYWSQTAKVITNSWLKEGLKPRCITRDLKWGIPVPLEGYTDKVFYVWFDAPIGYISITAALCPQWEKWWKDPDNVESYNFLAKDNVTFHAIIFPSTLLATHEKWSMVSHIPAVEYLNYEDSKFSKSRSIGVFGDSVRETGIPSDIWRFYLLYVRPENQDTTFCWNDLMAKNNTELLNNLGNFLNRVLTFLSNNFAATIGDIKLTSSDQELLVQLNRELLIFIDSMNRVKLRDGIKIILNISRIGNQYIQSEKPWTLVKDLSTRERAHSVLSLGANICLLLSILMEPYMPDTTRQLQEQINFRCNLLPKNHRFVCLLKPGHKIGKPSPLFKKLEQKEIDIFRKKFAGSNADREKETTNAVQLAKFFESISLKTDKELEQMIADQGDKVRRLKADKAEKKIINDEVQILLKLKSTLAEKK